MMKQRLNISTESPLPHKSNYDMVVSYSENDIQENELEDFIRLNNQMATAFDAETMN